MNIEDMIHRIQALFHHPDTRIPDEVIQNLIRSLEDELGKRLVHELALKAKEVRAVVG